MTTSSPIPTARFFLCPKHTLAVSPVDKRQPHALFTPNILRAAFSRVRDTGHEYAHPTENNGLLVAASVKYERRNDCMCFHSLSRLEAQSTLDARQCDATCKRKWNCPQVCALACELNLCLV